MLFNHERRPSANTALFQRINLEGHFKWAAQLPQPAIGPSISKEEQVIDKRKTSVTSQRSVRVSNKSSPKRQRKSSRNSPRPTDRYYFESQREFEKLLNDLNRRRTVYTHSTQNRLIVPTPQTLAARMYLNDAQIRLRCVGFVSVAMQMCSRCCDSGKPFSKKDKYYINELEIAKERTVLCHGCLGYMLDGLRDMR